MATSLKQDLIRLRRLKEEASRANAKAKKISLERDTLQARVFARMEDEEIDGMKVAGRNFVRSSTIYGSVQDRDLFIAWAEANDQSLVRPKEAGDLLNQLVRERIDNGEELPPGIGFYTRDIIKVTA